jgi:hypothetical protein
MVGAKVKQPPAELSNTEEKTAGESRLGSGSQSIAPSSAMSAIVRPSPIAAYALSGA